MISDHSRIIDLTVRELLELLNNSKNSNSLTNGSDAQRQTDKVDLNKLCSIYGFAKGTVYQWASKRYIPYSKIGKYLFFDLKEIDNWIFTNRVKTKTEILNS